MRNEYKLKKDYKLRRKLNLNLLKNEQRYFYYLTI